MGLSDWWEKRQQRKQEEESAKLLDLAEHPHAPVDEGTDIDELRTDLGTSKMGEMAMDDAHHIE
jgi:hypothetical protein